MRAILAAMLFGGLLLAGCGSDEAEKPKPGPGPESAPPVATPPKPPEKQWTDFAPGDPEGDIKALQHARKVTKEAEKTRQAPPDEPSGE